MDDFLRGAFFLLWVFVVAGAVSFLLWLRDRFING